MKYFVEIGEQLFQVEVNAQGSRLQVNLDGKVYEVDPCMINNAGRYSLLIDGRSVDVALEPRKNDMQLIVRGRDYSVIVEGERERRAREVEAAKGPEGEVAVLSQMPGVVRKVFVKDGDRVSTGDPLIILEAMKMENEIRAEVPGLIKDLCVQEGATVDGGAALLTIKIPESSGES